MSDSQSSTAPLLPWIAEEGISPLTQEIKDPVSGASITLPRLNGLTVNEVLFAQAAVEKYEFLKSGAIDSTPATVIALTEFAHHFLCLRLGLADWLGDGLTFTGEALTPADSLTMVGADGQKRAVSLYMLYLLYGFFVEEQTAWLSGKTEGGMMTKILSAIAPPQTGVQSIGESRDHFPDTPNSPDVRLDAALPTSSKGRLRQSKKSA